MRDRMTEGSRGSEDQDRCGGALTPLSADSFQCEPCGLSTFVDKSCPHSDTCKIMSLDLNDLLRDWPHEPGQLKVRKIVGADGRDKLQLRIDLGLIQMETTGR